MNKIALVAFLSAILGLGGCIIHSGPSSGDITFSWSFYGMTCAQAGVAAVQVTIPGESLDNGGYYGCENAGYPGITLHNFTGGTYGYTLQGLDGANNVIYQASGTVAVDGDVHAAVDLTPVGQPTSYALLSWSFRPNWASSSPSCAQLKDDATAGATAYVDVSIDGGAWQTYGCTEGMTSPGAPTILVSPGTHSIELVAYLQQGSAIVDLASASSTFTSSAFAPVSVSYTLNWVVGGASIAWQLSNNGAPMTCSGAGVAEVAVNFLKHGTNPAVAANWLYASDNSVFANWGDHHACTTAPIVYNYLPAGQYDVYTWGVGAAGNYSSSSTSPPGVQVVAGTFPTAASPLVIPTYYP